MVCFNGTDFDYGVVWCSLFVAEPDCFLQAHDGPVYDAKFYGDGEDALLLRFLSLNLFFSLLSRICFCHFSPKLHLGA